MILTSQIKKVVVRCALERQVQDCKTAKAAICVPVIAGFCTGIFVWFWKKKREKVGKIRLPIQQWSHLHNPEWYKDLLLTEFEGGTVSYRPSFSPSIYGPRAKCTGLKLKGENEDPYPTVQCSNSVRYLFYLHCVSDRLGNDFYSGRTVSNFWHTSKQNESIWNCC